MHGDLYTVYISIVGCISVQSIHAVPRENFYNQIQQNFVDF